jgi:hypothetical protein
VAYARLLGAGFVGIAVWTVATTVYIDWTAYSVLPWGDHWDHWRLYIAEGRLSPRLLFSPHNEHRIAVPRLLFWIDHRFFAASNVFLFTCILVVQLVHAGLLWRVGVPAGSGWLATIAAAGLTTTAAFASQQFTNFTWAFQIQFVLVYLLAHAAFAALLIAAPGDGRVPDSRARWTGTALAVALAWLSSLTMSNGMLAWPLLIVLGMGLRLGWPGLVVVAVNALLATVLYLQDRTAAGTLLEGAAQLPKAITYALVVLGLPVDDTASAVMQAFGLPTPRYPGLGGDGTAALAWRPPAAAVVGAVGVGYLAHIVRQSLTTRRRLDGRTIVLCAAAVFVLGSVLLIGLGRSSRFEIVAVMQSRYATPAFLFWTCLGLLFLRRDHPGDTRDDRSWRAEAVLAGLIATVAINQPTQLAYAHGYRAYLGEAEAAIAAGVRDPEFLKRFHPDERVVVSTLDYFKTHHLSVFATPSAEWTGQSVEGLFRVTADCIGYVDGSSALPSRTGLLVRGWAWDDREQTGPDRIVLADAGGRILAVAQTVERRDDVPAAMPGRVTSAEVGWRGVVGADVQTQFDAYLVRASDSTACRIGRPAPAVPSPPP